MVTLVLSGTGKRFAPGWVFRKLEGRFTGGERIAVTGYNGSGKSTLLRLLAGMIRPDEGSVTLDCGMGPVEQHSYYRHIAYTAPSLDLIGEFTPGELLTFYSRFREPAGFDALAMTGLDAVAGRRIQDLSSGMKQRLKLVLALGFKAELVLLDEPGSNLDETGLDWLNGLIGNTDGSSLLFIASNDPGRETRHCTRTLRLEDYKPH